jgi:hypothetical protein
MVFVAAVLGVSLAVAGTLIAVFSGGSSSHMPPRIVEHRTSAAAPPQQTYPLNTVYAGGFGIYPQGSTTTVAFGFTVVNPVPGTYTATWAQTPTGALTGTGTAAGGQSNPIVIPFTATQLGDYGQLKITAPGGTPIALGPVAGQLPLVLNAQTDVLTNYIPTALRTPIPGPAASSGQVETVTGFVDGLFHNLASGNVNGELNSLNPAVIDRYGAKDCRSWLATLTDPTAAITVKAVTGPSSFDYASSGLTTRIPNTFDLDATVVLRGQPIDQVVHVAKDKDGSDSWFTTCGAPLKPAK